MVMQYLIEGAVRDDAALGGAVLGGTAVDDAVLDYRAL